MFKLRNPFRRKSKPASPPFAGAPWQGDHADAAQIDFYVANSGSMDRGQLQQLPADVQGLVSAFYQMAKESTRVRDRHGLLKAWRFAQAHVSSRAETNRMAFMTVEQHARAMADQGAMFHQAATTLFGSTSFISVNGQQIISTREGGGLWYLRQMTLVVLNPVEQTREIQTAGSGDKKITVKKTTIVVDPGLFDDFIKLTPEGIVISNPDLGSDEFLVPWSQADTLILSTNATMMVDPINSWIRPMFRSLSQTQWIPFGTITIKDRQSGNLLVTALMMHPDKFKDKLQALVKKMKTVAVSPTRVDPVAPVDLEQFMAVLPGPVREEIMDMMGMDGRASRRRINQAPGMQIFTFRGQQYADEDTMRAEVDKAYKAIVREPDPNTRRVQLHALQQLAQKVRPLAHSKLLASLLDKVINAKVK